MSSSSLTVILKTAGGTRLLTANITITPMATIFLTGFMISSKFIDKV
jgi:hypothetical protein